MGPVSKASEITDGCSKEAQGLRVRLGQNVVPKLYDAVVGIGLRVPEAYLSKPPQWKRAQHRPHADLLS